MTRVTSLSCAGAVVIAAAFAACSKSSPSEPTASSTTSTATTEAVPTAPSFQVSPESPHARMGAAAGSAAGAADGPEVAWDAPASWTSMPNPNPMRKATYKIARAPGDADDAELTVSAAAGGVDANVKRWAGQFGNAEPKTEKKKVNGLDVTVVELKGTYSGGGMMMGAPSTPKEKQMLLGAVVGAGDRQYFFKMTGPEKTVSAARKDFDKLVASVHEKK